MEVEVPAEDLWQELHPDKVVLAGAVVVVVAT